MKKHFKTKLLFYIFPIIQFLITFFTDKYFFDLKSINMNNYILCKIVLLFVLFAIWQLFYYIFKNKKNNLIKYFLSYFIPMIIILLLIFPGYMYGADVYNFIGLSGTAGFLYYLKYLTSVFWIVSIMIFPFYSMVMVMQIFIMGLVITYIRNALEKIYPNNKKNNLIYFFGRLYKEFLSKIISNEQEIEYIHNKKKKIYSTFLDYAIVNNALFNLIQVLKETYNIALVTIASKKNTYEILNKFNKLKDFDLIITHEDVINVKPNPEGFLIAMKKFNISKDNTIIYEDSIPGIEAAVASGASVFKCIGFN